MDHDGGHGIQFSPDGTAVVSAGKDKDDQPAIFVNDAATGEELLRLTGHQDTITRVECHPDFKFIVSTARDGTIRFWDTTTGKQVGEVTVGVVEKVHAASLSSDGSFLAFATNDDTKRGTVIRFWDIEKAELRESQISTYYSPRQIRLSPDGDLLAVPQLGDIELWSVSSEEKLRKLTEMDDSINGIEFSADGSVLAAAGAAGRIRLWDVESGKRLHEPHGHPSHPVDVAFSPNGKTIASICDDAELRVWDISTNDLVYSQAVQNSHTYAVGFLADGSQIYVGGERGIAIVDAKTGRHIRTCGHVEREKCVALAEKQNLAVLGSYRDKVTWFELASGKQLHESEVELTPYLNKVLALSPNGLLAMPGTDGKIELWDAAIQKKSLTLEDGPGDELSCLSFSSDGTIIAAVLKDLAGSSKPSRLTMWDAGTGRIKVTAEVVPNFQAQSIAFRFDDQKLATAGEDGVVRLWDVETLTLLQEIRLARYGCFLRSVEFSPNGRYLVTANGNGTLTILDVGDVPSPDGN